VSGAARGSTARNVTGQMIAVDAGQHHGEPPMSCCKTGERTSVKKLLAFFRFRHAPMTGAAALSEPGAARLHRRDLGFDQHDAAL